MTDRETTGTAGHPTTSPTTSPATGPATGPSAGPPTATPDRRRWAVLVVVATAQLMIALDATIVNIALPSAQRDLGFSAADRQWVVTAYTLAFGGLLLLGGRLADVLGRRTALLLGLAGFAGASAVGGAAGGFGTLVVARAAQGGFGALLAPTALSVIAVTFTAPRDRARAFAVYGAIAGSGGAVGLLLGGALAEQLSWRWCLYVNVPVAVAAGVAAWLLVQGTPGRTGVRLDLPGAVVATSGLVALVYGCAQAVEDGWSSATVLGPLALSVVLLVALVGLETRRADPLVPLHLLRDRTRAGVYLAVGVAVAAMFGTFLFLTYYLQVVLGYGPMRAGVAFLPLSAAAFLGSGAIATRLLPYVAPRMLLGPALLVCAAGLAWLTRLTPDSAYVTHVLPAELLLGLGMSCVMVPAFSVATQGVSGRDAGAASALVNTFQQVGGSLGTAVLNTVAATAAAGYLAAHGGGALARAEGLVHGYATAAALCAGVLVVTAGVVGLLVDAPRPHRDTPS